MTTNISRMFSVSRNFSIVSQDLLMKKTWLKSSLFSNTRKPKCGDERRGGGGGIKLITTAWYDYLSYVLVHARRVGRWNLRIWLVFILSRFSRRMVLTIVSFSIFPFFHATRVSLLSYVEACMYVLCMYCICTVGRGSVRYTETER